MPKQPSLIPQLPGAQYDMQSLRLASDAAQVPAHGPPSGSQ